MFIMLSLKDKDGATVSRDRVEQAAKESAPYKRAVKEAGYRSRAPGGGPVVKRRVNEKSLERKLLQLGKEKLKIRVKEYEEGEDNRRERQKTKRKVTERWTRRFERDPIAINAESALSIIKRISERRGVANEDGILKRLRTNIQENSPQIILAVWGPPYEGQGYQSVFSDGSPEDKMAKSIMDVIDQLNSCINTRLIILYADYYGTAINGLSEDVVDSYGKQIKRRFEGVGELVYWSELRKENSREYEEKASNLTEATITPSGDEIEKALIMQQKLENVVTVEQARELAIMYRKERIIEGTILEDGFAWRGSLYTNIIKLGTAPSRFNNDELYESELPRFYVLGMPRAAWNTSRAIKRYGK